MSDMALYRHKNITSRMFSESITRDEIEEKRNKTKIGQKISILTIKSSEIVCTQPKYYFETKGKVIEKYPRFARLKLDNGPIEDVLWVDLIKMDREKERK